MVQGHLSAVGRYQVREVLGTGGFATVYRAHDPVLDREVALKVLHPHLGRDGGTRQRFVREGRSLARIRQPNVVHIYDAGEAETPDEYGMSLAYLAMELVEGRSLAEIIQQRGRLPLDETVEVVRQVAAGLAAVHARNLIHRDVKPANIMVEDGGHVVLLDLGVARATDVTATSTGYMLGTLGFMAPEQVEPGGQVTPQTDVYQLGATVFTMLTGHPPFGGEPTQTIYAIVHQPPPPLGPRRPDLPAEAAEVVMQSLAKDPARRPHNALAFASQLHEALNHPPAPPRVVETARQSSAAAIPPDPYPATIESAPTQSLPAPVAAWQTSIVERPAAAATPRRRGRALPLALAGVTLAAALAGGFALFGRSDERGAAQSRAVTPVAASPAPASVAAAAPATALPELSPAATPAPPPPTAEPAPVPTASPTPRPSPTPEPTPAPTPSRTPAPTPRATPAAVAVANPPSGDSGALAAAISRNGYVPSGPVVQAPATADGGVLTAQRAACATADGLCQKVFIAWNDRYLGTDTPLPSQGVTAVNPAGPGQISVTYANYAEGDPGCCPSLNPVTIVYTCNGSRCVPNRWPPPGQPASG